MIPPQKPHQQGGPSIRLHGTRYVLFVSFTCSATPGQTARQRGLDGVDLMKTMPSSRWVRPMPPASLSNEADWSLPA